MRIACIYLPSFPLQAHVRRTPHLAGAVLAVVDQSRNGSTVMSCSRAAWTSGIRSGMTLSTARLMDPELQVFARDPGLYRQTLAAVTDTLMSICELVDAGPETDEFTLHQAVYVRVPARVRGASFGHKVLTQLSRQGFRGRVGVADDRFTAYAAAVTVALPGRTARLDTKSDAQPPLFHQSCTSVPRGGSTAFLAPLPLSYLPIDRDVQGMLQTCGVKNLGDFAALPPPSLGRDAIDIDLQALARGHDPTPFRGLDRNAVQALPVVERTDLPEAATAQESLSFVLRTTCARVCQRLEGRQRVAAELAVQLRGPAQQSTEWRVRLPRPSATVGDVLDAVQNQCALAAPGHPITGVEICVICATEITTAELDLFAAANNPSGSGLPAATGGAGGVDGSGCGAVGECAAATTASRTTTANHRGPLSTISAHRMYRRNPGRGPGQRPRPRQQPQQQHLFAHLKPWGERLDG